MSLALAAAACARQNAASQARASGIWHLRAASNPSQKRIEHNKLRMMEIGLSQAVDELQARVKHAWGACVGLGCVVWRHRGWAAHRHVLKLGPAAVV